VLMADRCGAKMKCYGHSTMGDEDAAQAMRRASGLIDERKFQEALAPAKEACRLSPSSPGAWRNYAIALKHTHAWSECLAACERAHELEPEASGGACWNAGIAATALEQWPRARRAWTEYGLVIPAGDGPLEMELGIAGVRVAIETEPEIVLCQRLDPCRARILSVPLPESGRRFGDIVLHDGERRGERELESGTIPVFDELTLLRQSAYGTWQVRVQCEQPAERDAVIALFTGIDGTVEDWSENLTMMCAQCSAGIPHDTHPPPAASPWRPVRNLGLALTDERELDRLKQSGAWRPGVRDVTRVL
jgi:hypothetical protein